LFAVDIIKGFRLNNFFQNTVAEKAITIVVFLKNDENEKFRIMT